MLVDVIYIAPKHEFYKSIALPQAANVEQAICQSGILEQCRHLTLNTLCIGIFNSIVTLDTVLQDGDRVEVYSDLVMDPMQARRLRAKASAG